MYISITAVQKGDTIVDGRSKTVVDRVEHNACSSNGTHINNRECYERGSMVQVQAGRAESKHFEESALGDLEEDYEDMVRHFSGYKVTVGIPVGDLRSSTDDRFKASDWMNHGHSI